MVKEKEMHTCGLKTSMFKRILALVIRGKPMKYRELSVDRFNLWLAEQRDLFQMNLAQDFRDTCSDVGRHSWPFLSLSISVPPCPYEHDLSCGQMVVWTENPRRGRHVGRVVYPVFSSAISTGKWGSVSPIDFYYLSRRSYHGTALPTMRTI